MSIRSLFVFLSYSSIFLMSSCTPQNSAEQENLVTGLQNQLTEAQNEIKSLEETQAATPGLIHSVFFWLKEDLTEEQKAAFQAGVASLKEIASVSKMYIGPTAPTEERGVVDNSYSTALIVHFADVAAHDAYQIDPIHRKFVDEQKDKWSKVVVYDNLVD